MRTTTNENEECTVDRVGEMPVYSGIVCEVVYTVYSDIHVIYNRAFMDSKLTELTTSSWLAALVHLVTLIRQVVIVSPSNSPKSTIDGGLINGTAIGVCRRVKEMISEKLDMCIKEKELEEKPVNNCRRLRNNHEN